MWTQVGSPIDRLRDPIRVPRPPSTPNPDRRTHQTIAYGVWKNCDALSTARCCCDFNYGWQAVGADLQAPTPERAKLIRLGRSPTGPRSPITAVRVSHSEVPASCRRKAAGSRRSEGDGHLPPATPQTRRDHAAATLGRSRHRGPTCAQHRFLLVERGAIRTELDLPW